MPGPQGLTRRSLLWRAGAAAAALYALSPPPPLGAQSATTWTDVDYWAFADRTQALLDPLWRSAGSAYAGPRGGLTSLNANMLFTHAAAARAGHTGPARQDARARRLIDRLCASPPWLENEPGSPDPCASTEPALWAGDQAHPCGWGAGLTGFDLQHVVIDTEVVRALAQAYAARASLGLSDSEVQTIQDRVSKVAFSPFYAYPALRLNQINWPIEIYAHAHSVLGADQLLRNDCWLQLDRFADALTEPAPGMVAANTGPGYRFHYLPHLPAHTPRNLDSAEYATSVCSALLFYEQARAAGMAALTADQRVVLRAWVERVLCGYWTHGGYLNWDTGLGFSRWHQVKKPPLSQRSLLAIALSPDFAPSPAHRRWAKHFFDRALQFWDRVVSDGAGLPPNVMFAVTRTSSAPIDGALAAARMQANAAEACTRALARIRAEEPPPLYAYDPDIGRLAITTPAYNTVVIAVNQHAFPYGGVELARLFDGDQRVAAAIGGRPPAAFGVVVSNRRSGHETETQRGRTRPDLREPPLRLLEAPRGAVAHPVAYPRRAYAGAFDRLVAAGSTRGPGVTIHTRHHFMAAYVETRWRVVPDEREHDRHDVSVLFPSTGPDVAVLFVLRDGGERLVTGDAQVDLTNLAWMHLAGSECGYVVVPRAPVLSGVARILHPPAQESAPRPGPTVAFELLDNARLRRLTACVRIAPAREPDEARRVAGALG